MKAQNNNSVQDQDGNSSKPLLPAVFLSTIDKQQKFLSELKELLVKYNAELSVTDHNSYEDRLVVEFNYDESFFEKEGTGIIPDLDLGRWEDGR
jgi:tetraacyldisaccharide-1-P 4'-kinase